MEITVLREGRSGILGIGAEEALVRVTLLPPKPRSAVAEAAKDVLEKLLSLMEVPAAVKIGSEPGAPGSSDQPVLNIEGDDLGILIGRRGQTLACLQYIVRLIVGHQTKTWLPLVIDVEGYKERRYQALEIFARNMAEQVKSKGVAFTMEPMPAYERRIVHLALANHPNVTTESIGEGEARKVVIVPRKR